MATPPSRLVFLIFITTYPLSCDGPENIAAEAQARKRRRFQVYCPVFVLFSTTLRNSTGTPSSIWCVMFIS